MCDTGPDTGLSWQLREGALVGLGGAAALCEGPGWGDGSLRPLLFLK